MEHPISQRIKILIDRESNGKVVDFANKLEGIPYQVISRLFKKDSRNDKWPTPSTELIIQIINKFTYYNIIWLMTGEGEMINSSIYSQNEIQQNIVSEKEGNYNDDYWHGRYDELLRQFEILKNELAELKRNK